MFFPFSSIERSAPAEVLTGTTSQERFMRVLPLISLAAAILLTSQGFAAPYDNLATKGCRWVTTNGPYACPAKDDLRQIVQHHTDQTELQMIEQPRAYYLIEGAIVQSWKMQPRACPRSIRPKLDPMFGPSLYFSASVLFGTPTEKSRSHCRTLPRIAEISSRKTV